MKEKGGISVHSISFQSGNIIEDLNSTTQQSLTD